MKHCIRWLGIVVVALIVASVSVGVGSISAAPSPPVSLRAESAQLPDWLSSESASRLDIGISVYAPSWLPSPFGSEPEIQAYDGYYSFYWLVPGMPVTYLRVTGEAGGSIPDYSAYDRNNQLVQNATVMGYAAWHDLTPAYDLVYWQVGNVVYSVDSLNVGADSLTIANSLMLVTPPAPAQVGGQEEPTVSSISLAAPASVNSGQTASIGITGQGQVLLSAQDGYFPETGENTIIIEAGASVDWVAPEYESDATLYFYAYNPETGAELTSTSTYLEGYLSEGETVSALIECSSPVTIGTQVQVVITGTGSIGVVASGGSFPAEMPNTAFDANASGGSSLVGTLPSDSGVVLGWLAPDSPGTYYLSLFDTNDTFLHECAVEVVEEDVAETVQAAPVTDGSMGDGTGVTGVDPAVVLRAIANPSGFAGDASGGPEANASDYGFQLEASSEPADNTSEESEAVAAAEEEAADAEAVLGPATGAGGMVALSMGRHGGVLENPAGARVI
ncbi:MAG: hypothetical protein AB7V46_12615, partial [Thermomicrobiales bacterium]